MAVESDSQQPRLRAKVIEMIKIAADSLEDLGATVTLSEMGIQQVLILRPSKDYCAQIEGMFARAMESMKTYQIWVTKNLESRHCKIATKKSGGRNTADR